MIGAAFERPEFDANVRMSTRVSYNAGRDVAGCTRLRLERTGRAILSNRYDPEDPNRTALRSFGLAVFVAFGVMSSGCGDGSGGGDAGTRTCTPGNRVECPCPEGGLGVQTCEDSGRFGPCRCIDGGGPGDTTPDGGETPDASPDWPPSGEPTFQSFAVGARHTCGVTEGGDVMCWGDDSSGQVGAANDVDTEAVDISAGADHSCLVDGSSEIRCWGSNAVGQLGKDPSTSHDSPVSPTWSNDEPKPTANVASGLEFNVIFTDSDDVGAWGENDSRQSRPGFGNLDEPSWRAAVLGLLSGPFTSMTAGARHACALHEDGSIRCWGNNRDGQLGFGPCEPNDSPCSDDRVVEWSGAFVDVAAGARHTCALGDDGSVQCRGGGEKGQLGDGGETAMSTASVSVDLDAELASLGRSLGDTQCGVTSDGDVVCWGANGEGQATGRSGDGDVVEPTRLGLPGSATEVASGAAHTCARFESGHLRCWGDDADGQIGEFALAAP